MAWLKTDDRLDEHPKFMVLSDGAFRLWHRARGWQATQRDGLGLDGRIPKKVVRALTGNRADWQDLQDELTTSLVEGKAPLWEDAGEQWQIHDYLEYNPSAADIQRQRDKWREKKTRQRAEQEKQGDEGEGDPEGAEVCPPGTPRGTLRESTAGSTPGSPRPTRTHSRTNTPSPEPLLPGISPPASPPTPPPSRRGGGAARGAPPPDRADDVVLWIPVVGKVPTTANAYGAPFRHLSDVNAPDLGEHRWHSSGEAYEYGVRQAEVAALEAAFPGVNALNKLRGLRQWARGQDAKNRYTYDGLSKFIAKRFDIEQNDNARRQRPSPTPMRGRAYQQQPADPGRSEALAGVGEEWKP